MRKAASWSIATGVATAFFTLGLTATAVEAAVAGPPATSVAATHAARNSPQCPNTPGGCFPPTVRGQSEGYPSLNIRSGPSTNTAIVGSMPYLSWGTVTCYTTGTNINGDDYWDFTIYNGSQGYVSDYYLYTAGNIYQQVWHC
jgi:hypothetical protein